MQKVKTCPVCGGQFVTNRNTTIYCSKVCYGADSSRKKARRTNIDVGYRELVAPPRDEFNLEVGDLITGPDKQLDGDKNRRHEFRVTKIYKHFFEAVRIDRGWATELNEVSWNGAEPKYDIRRWNADHTKMGKGITLTKAEATSLLLALQEELK